MTCFLMITGILLPAAAGALLPLFRSCARKTRLCGILAVLVLECIDITALAFAGPAELTLFSMTETLTVRLRVDSISRLFMLIACYGFLLAGIFAFRYMDNEEEEGAFPEYVFFSFYLLSLGALIGMDLSATLISMYLFFEMITLLSMPMVLYERTRESITAALKYLFYSVAGAFLALGCIFVLAGFSDSMELTAGGFLDPARIAGHEDLIRVMLFLGLVGFGAKAGMYPLHGWLPSAHPVAPSPASAVLSGIIAKAGVLAIIRLLYFAAGPAVIAGTWAQYVLLGMALLTVFMGSMMAYREKIFKKRLAYSSVSQISYVLFGVFLMTADGLTGALMQVLFHACVKICLFLTAGSLIYNTGYKDVREYRALGRTMPMTFIAFTLASLSLIGIPPFAGFVSKWYLAVGSLDSGIPVYSWLGPVILLVSALLTAGYLLPITVAAFFPGKGERTEVGEGKKEGGPLMVVPLLILSVLSLVLGLMGGLLYPVFGSMTAGLF